jgi:hypothetical protein
MKVESMVKKTGLPCHHYARQASEYHASGDLADFGNFSLSRANGLGNSAARNSRAGLTVLKRGWITVGEYNYDIAERSYYLDSNQLPRGQFSPNFLEEIRQALRPLLIAHEGRIDRTK